MKIKAWVIVVIALVLVATVAFGIRAYVHQRVQVAVAMERIKVAEAQVADLDAEINKRNAVIDERDATLEAARQAALERERWFQTQLAHVQTATPAELVDQGSQILGVSDIKSDGVTVQMSLETYRKIVFRLVEHQEYVNVREPAWNAREALYQAQISDQKGVILAHEKKDVLNANIIAGLKDVITHTKNMGFFEKAAWTAGGFALGVLTEKIR